MGGQHSSVVAECAKVTKQGSKIFSVDQFQATPKELALISNILTQHAAATLQTISLTSGSLDSIPEGMASLGALTQVSSVFFTPSLFFFALISSSSALGRLVPRGVSAAHR